ncbi:uncharacterized protein C2845_PM01G19650 [Panicum miliaceum]|uniref:Uncharacterized protein n=1 Tax=Panicum miliaceum TaxID=4540 RepID=A0A3L6TUU8_PANMI|nr:uncharacterized protein C2845_PM01G19650 [Panicum miliaceum]
MSPKGSPEPWVLTRSWPVRKVTRLWCFETYSPRVFNSPWIPILWRSFGPAISKVFSTRDIFEEYVSYRCWPLKFGWAIRGWLPKDEWVEGIPTPDFVKSFNLKKHSNNGLMLKDKYSQDLAAAQVKVELAEAHAKNIEKKWGKSRDFFRRYRQCIIRGIDSLRADVPRMLACHGLAAPALPGSEDLEIGQFFLWLRSCLAMAESGSRLHGDLCAMVSARTMAASICKLLLDEAGDSFGAIKSSLRQLREPDFNWPSEDEVTPEKLPILLKNIAKNFVGAFFKGVRASLVYHEKLRMKEQIQMKAEAYAWEALSGTVGTTSSEAATGNASVVPPVLFPVNLASTFEDQDTVSERAEDSAARKGATVEPAAADDTVITDADDGAATGEV